MKRIVLFLITNLAVLLILGIVLNLLFGALGMSGDSLGGLLLLAGLFGMGGSFLSLALSKWMAKRTTGARVIGRPRNQTEAWLVATVNRQARAVGLKPPEVAIYPSPDVNAFATGMRRNDALVAVSAGLLESMTQQEVEAVLAHEVSHIANGDMVTLTLIQGVLNTFVILVARLVGGFADRLLSGEGEEEGGQGGAVSFIVTIALELVLGVLASMVVMWFSRQREFRADRGGSRLVGVESMRSALKRLKMRHDESRLPPEVAALGLRGGLFKLGPLFASHPPLEERIAALSGRG